MNIHRKKTLPDTSTKDLPWLDASGDSLQMVAVLALRVGRSSAAGRAEKWSGGWSPGSFTRSHRLALLVRLVPVVPALAPASLPLIRVALAYLKRNEEKNYEKRGQGRGER